MITLIVNPTAGNGRAKNVAEQVEKRLTALGLAFRTKTTAAPADATAMATELGKDYREGDYLIVVGGDGTFSEVIRGLRFSDLPVACVPAGTGNDLLKSLGVPADPAEALEHILSAEVRAVDVGVLNGTPFANECGAGFDVAVLDHANSAKKHCKGLLPYLWGVLKAIFTYRCFPVSITADGEEVYNGNCTVISVANGRFIGGGIEISPQAELQNGTLDLTVVDGCSKPRMCTYLPGLLSGKILNFKHTTVHRQAKYVIIRSEKPFRVNIDGEIRKVNFCDISVVPSALNVHM